MTEANYNAIPEQFRDLCADRENAREAGFVDGSPESWEAMVNSALLRKECA